MIFRAFAEILAAFQSLLMSFQVLEVKLVDLGLVSLIFLTLWPYLADFGLDWMIFVAEWMTFLADFGCFLRFLADF